MPNVADDRLRLTDLRNVLRLRVELGRCRRGPGLLRTRWQREPRHDAGRLGVTTPAGFLVDCVGGSGHDLLRTTQGIDAMAIQKGVHIGDPALGAGGLAHFPAKTADHAADECQVVRVLTSRHGRQLADPEMRGAGHGIDDADGMIR